MKTVLYPHPFNPRDSDPLGYGDMDILPAIGHVIRYENHAGHHEDGTVEEIRWDVTDEDASFLVLVVKPI